MEKKMRFRYFKTEEDFIKNLLYIRHYFGEDASNIMSRDFVFPNGVSGSELLEKYNRECEKERRYNQRYQRTPKPLRDRLPAPLIYKKEYETIFSIMEVLRTNFIGEKTVDYVLENSTKIFNTYFDEKLKDAEVQLEI